MILKHPSKLVFYIENDNRTLLIQIFKNAILNHEILEAQKLRIGNIAKEKWLSISKDEYTNFLLKKMF